MISIGKTVPFCLLSVLSGLHEFVSCTCCLGRFDYELVLYVFVISTNCESCINVDICTIEC